MTSSEKVKPPSLPFEEAKKYVQAHSGAKTREEYIKWHRTEKPKGIPLKPDRKYKNEGWISWRDWLGYDYWPFEEAREFVRKLELKNSREYIKWASSEERPDYIPRTPKKVYKNEGWKDWADWLGTDNKYHINEEKWPFEEAREFVHKLKLKNQDEWRNWCGSGNKPSYIPASPDKVYKNTGWKDWPDWFGTNFIPIRKRRYRAFSEVKEYIRGKFKGKEEYEKWWSNERPKDIPFHPERYYKKEWISWPDFLGYEGDWNVKKVKELLRAWIKSGVIYDAKDIVLHSLLAANGLLNLHNNRHSDFFKNLPEARHTTEGLKAIIDHAFSDSEEPPELEGHHISPDEDIQTASMEELKEIVKDETDPLDHIKVEPWNNCSETLRDWIRTLQMWKKCSSLSISTSVNGGHEHFCKKNQQYRLQETSQKKTNIMMKSSRHFSQTMMEQIAYKFQQDIHLRLQN